MKQKHRNHRKAFSLLELIVTAAIMALLVTSVSMVLRSSQTAWNGHDSDHTRLESAHATVRHLVRHIRQSESIIAMTPPRRRRGSITVKMYDGKRYVWAMNRRNVNFGENRATTLLAENISQLRFEAFKADGVTPTTVPNEIYSVRISATVQLSRGAAATQTVSSWAWLRSW